MLPIFPILGQVLAAIALWPVFAFITVINELLRLLVSLALLFSRVSLDPDGFDNIFYIQHLSNRVVVAALYSNQCLTSADLGHDYDKFRECIFNKRDAKGGLVYGKLRRTAVTRFGYGCHRNDAEHFQLANHVKFYSETTPRNGDFFTEDEFSSIICLQIIGIGYGENFTVSGLSQCLEQDELEELLDDLVCPLQTDE